MKYLFPLLVLVSLWSCQDMAKTPELAVEKLFRDYELQPAPERASVFIDSLNAFLSRQDLDDPANVIHLERGVDVSIKEGKLASAPGLLLTLLRNYDNLPNRKKHLVNLADVLQTLQKTHASDIIYMDLLKQFPNDAAVAEKKRFITDLAREQEDYLTYLFDQLLVNPDEFGINRQAALNYVDAVEAKALVSPEDPSVPRHLFGAAEIARSMKTMPKALSLYDWIIEDYPKSEKAPNVLFLKGYIIEQDYNDTAAAKKLYEEFLEKYPENQLAESVEFLLQNIGKTDEEILAEIERKNKANNN